MKKIILSSIIMLLTANLFAQPGQKPDGPPKPPPISERWKRDSIKLQLYVNMNADQIAGVKNIFITFYNSLDALVSKQSDAPAEREDIGNIIKTRKDGLKTVLNEKQFDRFEAFEREFMPPPPPKPGNRKMPSSQL
jgi:Holliday junction resolvase RusA-like endonuclease